MSSGFRRLWQSLLLSGLLALAGGQPAGAGTGDLNGDGRIGALDYSLFLPFFGSLAGDLRYDPAADVDGNGAIGASDASFFTGKIGLELGSSDTTPPTLFVTLNDIPDDMNDVLVVPPNGFVITIDMDSGGESLLDLPSLSVTSSQAVGSLAPGAELLPSFDWVSPTRATYTIPDTLSLARTTHELTVSVRDLAGNEALQTFAFAVRDFSAGPPLGNPQVVHVDFDQDRNLGPELDFLESMREFGLSSPADPVTEQISRDTIVAEIIRQVCHFYGLDASCQPDPDRDPVNITFSSTTPTEPHSRICVGGESPQGGSFLGAATLDKNNLVETSDECATASLFGVFPHAIDNLWGGDPGFQSAFAGVDPDLGGTPFGEDPLDAIITAPSWDIDTAPAAERTRAFAVIAAAQAFSSITAAGIAHEVGHMLGLAAPGPVPGGLYGGESGGRLDHNVTTLGGTPSQNYLMNTGASFSYEEIAGPLRPVFRPLAAAYLHDRIALNDQVTELLPPIAFYDVTTAGDPDPAPPAVVVFDSSSGDSVEIVLKGQNFSGIPVVELSNDALQLPLATFNEQLVDSETVTAQVSRFLIAPLLFDVRIVSGDDQSALLEDALLVVFE